jgi:hypothetical protein
MTSDTYKTMNTHTPTEREITGTTSNLKIVNPIFEGDFTFKAASVGIPPAT